MGQDEIHILKVLAKYLVFPVIGFLSGFAVQWFLQERKSRNELLQALAPQRAEALRKLWIITTLPPEITKIQPRVAIPENLRKQADLEIVEWYTQNGGALFLSWQATHLVFQLLDILRDDKTQKTQLENAISALRTRLKYDCGMYSYWEAKRQIKRPRPSPWLAEVVAVSKVDNELSSS